MHIFHRKMNTIRGFTIIETLVAITVLMVAVAGPLSVAGRGLTAAMHSKDQMIATLLAQESMETIKNIRDNNRANNQPSWLTGLSSCVGTFCDVSSVNRSLSYTPDISSPCTSDGCTIYLGDIGYSHKSTDGSDSGFKRYSTITQVSGSKDYIARVTVIWKEGTLDNEVDLYSELTDASR